MLTFEFPKIREGLALCAVCARAEHVCMYVCVYVCMYVRGRVGSGRKAGSPGADAFSPLPERNG